MKTNVFSFAILMLGMVFLFASCGGNETVAPVDSTLSAQGTFKTVRLYTNSILQDTILVNVIRLSSKQILFQQQDGLEFKGDIVDAASNGFTFLINKQTVSGKVIEGVKTQKEDNYHGFFDVKEAGNQAYGFKIKIGTSLMLYNMSRVK